MTEGKKAQSCYVVVLMGTHQSSEFMLVLKWSINDRQYQTRQHCLKYLCQEVEGFFLFCMDKMTKEFCFIQSSNLIYVKELDTILNNHQL